MQSFFQNDQIFFFGQTGWHLSGEQWSLSEKGGVLPVSGGVC